MPLKLAIQHEAKSNRAVTTICDGVGEKSEARFAGEPETCVGIRTPSGNSWAGDIGFGPDARAGTCHLKLIHVKNAFTKLAGIFFTDANTAIEEKHRAAREIMVTEEVSAIKGKCHDKCLEESLELQNCLRQLTHRVLAAQEDERKKLSHELQDEIAQTLLGINVRLLSLKQGDRNNTKGLKNEIASTQRLVVKSAKSVRQVRA